MVTLNSIAAQVEQITAAYPDFSLEQADVFSLLDVIGDENAHLQRMSTDALSWKRTMPLKEDQPVLGDYLCIEYTAHRPELSS